MLEAIDLAVVGAYFVVTIVLGLFIARRERGGSEDDYFVAGRKLGWLAIGASLFATNISSEHVIGLAADGYRSGLAVGNYEWGATLVLLLLGAVFVPFYVGTGLRTMPEFLERRFGTGSRIYLSVITIVANVFVRISVGLYAGGLVIEQLLGIDMWTAIVVMAAATVVYTAAGGLKAVVYTDVVQATIVIGGSVVLTGVALGEVGGVGALLAETPRDAFDMVRPASDPEMPWPGLLLGVPVLGVWYWCTDQVIVQRVLGARSVHQARMGTIFAAALKIIPPFIFVLPGLCARVLYPEIDSKAAFPTLLANLLPTGLKGLVTAGLIAALMSTLSSTLNSTGTLVSLDFFRRFRPEASAKAVVRVGRLTIVAVMIFGMAWVLVVERAESLFQYLQQVNAAISPPIAASFLVGVFWRRANHAGVMAALFGGLVLGVTLLLWAPLPFLLAAAVTFAASLGILAVVSWATPPPESARVASATLSAVGPILDGQTTPGQRRLFAAGAVGLALLMAGLWTVFSGVVPL